MAGIEMTMKREGSTMIPTAAMFEDDLRKIPEDREVFVTIRMARNPQFHKWFFAALNQIVKSGQWDGTIDSLILWLKIATGHVHKYDEDGKTYHVLNSWSFASMDELSFRDLVDRAKYVLADRLGINMDEIFARADADVTPNDPTSAANGAVPGGMRETRFDATFLDRLTALHMQLRQHKTAVDMESFYAANRDEFGALIQIDRDCVASVYSASLRRAKGDIDLDEEITFVNDRLNQHEDEPA